MGSLGLQCVHSVSKMIVVFGIILALVIDKYYGFKLEKDILKRLKHKNKNGEHKYFENICVTQFNLVILRHLHV